MARTTETPARCCSIGIDENPTLKEEIARVHGNSSRQMRAVNQLEEMLGNTRASGEASHKFSNFIRHHLPRPYHNEALVDEFVNSGYIIALERLRAPNSARDLDFYESYAADHGMSVPAAILFGPNGSAREAFSRWRVAEALRGQHRSCYRPADRRMAAVFDEAVTNTYRLPQITDSRGNTNSLDIPAPCGPLPAGMESQITKAFGREPQLYQSGWYRGTKRLSGDLPYRILEAMAVEILINGNHHGDDDLDTRRSKLETIVEDANQTGCDAFLALYDALATGRQECRYAWDEARRILNERAELLWRQRRRPDRPIVRSVERGLPGTVYLNNGRYYWLPKHGYKPLPLVPKKAAGRIPGSLLKNEPGGYFWWIPSLKFRRRMVPHGQKRATKNLKTAQRLQRQTWRQIQQDEPELAEKIKGMRKWGAATRHKPTAYKLARRFWDQMQHEDPRTAEQILSNGSPQVTRPDIDVVWPSWDEQQARMRSLRSGPTLPIVYSRQGLHQEWKYGLRPPEGLETMVEKVKKVDWMVRDTMLVFDDNTPAIPANITATPDRNGRASISPQPFRRYVLAGATSVDDDTGRLRIAVYRPGFAQKRVLVNEVYRIVLAILRQSQSPTYEDVQRWYARRVGQGISTEQTIEQAFTDEMGLEETGVRSSLPRGVVKNARHIFSHSAAVSVETMANVKDNWPAPVI